MKKQTTKKLNNRGAALLMVIVTVAFISIIVTILLYLATMNFQMKATDYNTRVSFYGAETPLEELRSVLVTDVSTATQKAYEQVVLQYGSMSSDARQGEFQKLFFQEMKSIWDDRTTQPIVPPVSGNWIWGVDSVLPLNPAQNGNYHVIAEADWMSTKCSTNSCSSMYHIIIEDLAGATHLVERTSDGRMEFKGIYVIYTEGSFSSIVKTDFCIYVPQIDWSVENYADDWDDTKNTNEHKNLELDACVTYMDYSKQ